MTRRALLTAALCASSLVACRGDRPPEADTIAVRLLDTPGEPGSGEPSVAALPDGRTLLSWLEPRGEKGQALRFATRPAGGEWSEPSTIASGENWFVNWADFPSVAALPDGTLFAHWLETSAPGGYNYDVRMTRSTDGGRAWSPAVTVHDDGVAAEHGFVSMTPAADGSMAIAWLDGREAAGEHGSGHGAGAMTLRAALVDRSGVKRAERRVDERVCDCCQTAVASAGGALVVAYRDRSPDEVRDVVVRRLPGGAEEWSDAQPVGAEGWRIAGCPVNGPALAADGDRVAVAWFTLAAETPRVKVAFSSDAGATWSAPTTIDEGKPLGRVDVAWIDGRSALVAWVESARDSAELRARQVGPDGTAAPSVVVAETSGARATGFPRMDRQGEEIVLAWRDSGEPPRIRSAALSVAAPRSR